DERARPARIVLESQDGAWRGSSRVVTGVGVQSGTVAVALEALAALEVHVVDAGGAPLSNAFVAWTPADAKPRDVTVREDGRADFERIPPGAGTLAVRLVRWGEVEMPLVLAPAIRHVETVTLARVPSAGWIAGTVPSAPGASA